MEAVEAERIAGGAQVGEAAGVGQVGLDHDGVAARPAPRTACVRRRARAFQARPAVAPGHRRAARGGGRGAHRTERGERLGGQIVRGGRPVQEVVGEEVGGPGVAPGDGLPAGDEAPPVLRRGEERGPAPGGEAQGQDAAQPRAEAGHEGPVQGQPALRPVEQGVVHREPGVGEAPAGDAGEVPRSGEAGEVLRGSLRDEPAPQVDSLQPDIERCCGVVGAAVRWPKTTSPLPPVCQGAPSSLPSCPCPLVALVEGLLSKGAALLEWPGWGVSSAGGACCSRTLGSGPSGLVPRTGPSGWKGVAPMLLLPQDTCRRR